MNCADCKGHFSNHDNMPPCKECGQVRIKAETMFIPCACDFKDMPEAMFVYSAPSETIEVKSWNLDLRKKEKK